MDLNLEKVFAMTTITRVTMNPFWPPKALLN